MKTIALHNLGCKVNAYELDAMQQLLEEAGYQIVSFEDKADYYLINTCTVTNMADRKSRQMIHRAKKKNQEAVVIAVGCYVQAQKESGEDIDGADIVVGNNRKKDIVTIIDEYEQTHNKVTEEIIDINHTKEYERMAISKTGEHTRAYIKVQDGCNQFCSYCIIPFARGRVRSRSTKEVLEEIRELADNGYKEFVLTGIHLSSYGTDLENASLLSLIDEVSRLQKVFRIRLGSLEPRIITREFVEALASNPKFCPHFHLSLQSGCDATLQRMNRHYTAKEFKEACDLLRCYFKNPALTTDIIVGFPMESEAEFEETYQFVSGIHFYETHIFPYSRRQGTKAASMEGQISGDIKKRRSERLTKLHQMRKKEFEENFIGKEVEVLFEESVLRKGETFQVGHTREYIKVFMKTEEDLKNQIIHGCIGETIQIAH